MPPNIIIKGEITIHGLRGDGAGIYERQRYLPEVVS